MKLTIDIEISDIQISDLEISAGTLVEEKGGSQSVELQALAYLLSRAHRSTIAKPFLAKVCEDFNLIATPDFPIAALSAQAEKFDVEGGYWFCAAPVHLALQRDAFFLHEEVPLRVNVEHAQALQETLNQHFKEDGLQFLLSASGAWYLKLTHLFEHFLPVKTHFPQMAVGKNIHAWMPEGPAAQKWRALLNELQMVLFEHPVNQAREAAGELAINSIWLSGGGFMPCAPSAQLDDLLLMSDHPFYAGLAQYLHAQSSPLPDSFAALLQKKAANVRMFLPIEHSKKIIAAIHQGLKTKKISKLMLNIGFYEQTVIAEIFPRDCYKFWCKTKPLSHFFKSLNFYD